MNWFNRIRFLIDEPACAVVILGFLAVLFYGYPIFNTPQIYSYPDGVLYQCMAKDFAHQGAIQWDRPFRTRVPPLFPLFLSIGYAAGTRMMVHASQVILTQTVFFSSLIPLYLLSRRILSHPQCLQVLLLFCVMPVAMSSQRLMSEVIYVPLFVWALYTILALMDRRPRAYHAIPIFVVFSLSILTRLQAAVLFGILFMALLPETVQRFRARDYRGMVPRLLWQGLVPAGLTAGALFAVWKGLGYFDSSASPIYLENPPLDFGIVSRFARYLGLNLAVCFLAIGLLPALPLLLSLFNGEKEEKRWKSYLFVVMGVFLIHWLLMGYASYWNFSRNSADKTYCRYLAPVIPLLLPLCVHGLSRVQAWMRSGGFRKFFLLGAIAVCPLIVVVWKELILKMLWESGSNLGIAPWGWLLYRTGLSGFPLYAVLFFAGLIWLVLNWAGKNAGYWALFFWMSLLQFLGQDFRDFSLKYVDGLHHVHSIQSFCLDYGNRNDTLPIVVQGRDEVVIGNVAFWTKGEALVLEEAKTLPPAYYFIGDARDSAPVAWSDGVIQVYRVE